jgi:hypothetical protein
MSDIIALEQGRILAKIYISSVEDNCVYSARFSSEENPTENQFGVRTD